MAGVYKSLLVFVIVALIQRQCLAAQHVVGGSQGWDETTDYNSWATGQTFKVGDTLVFKYSSGLHSVVEIGDETAYKGCDTGSSLKSMNTGNDVVKLDKPGTRYFVCGTSGHCDAGMKLKITTVAGNGSSSSSTTPSSTSSAVDLHFFATSFYVIAALAATIFFFMLSS